MKRGVPPTAVNARTGEFTPPGVTARARSKSASLASVRGGGGRGGHRVIVTQSAKAPESGVGSAPRKCLGPHVTLCDDCSLLMCDGPEGAMVAPAPSGELTQCRTSDVCTRPRRSFRSPCCPPRGRPASPASVPDPRAPTPKARGTLPDGTVLPDRGDRGAGQRRRRRCSRAGQRSTPGSASGIPQAALAAYQRAEAVINAGRQGLRPPVGADRGDRSRRVRPRPLRRQQSSTTQGVARPGIYGIALNGKNNTQRISDTDAGQYDDDTRFDRAVGPMQFIPSTWSVVGRRRRQRRHPQPAGRRRRGTRDRRLPLLRRRRPVGREGPARLGLPLQPLQRLRRPGPVDHAGLHGRRLQRRCRPRR